MTVFEKLALWGDWERIKAGTMNADEVKSLVTHMATVALSGATAHAYVAGNDATALGTAAGVLAGVLYKLYLSRKLLNTAPPAAK